MEKPGGGATLRIGAMRIPIVALRVLDHERALRFYTETMGFEPVDDIEFPGMRWLTVRPPGSDVVVLLERAGPPVVDPETREQLDALVAKGVGGTLFLETGDVRTLFDRLVDAGVEVIQEPIERDYGTDVAIRDDSGNHVRINQPPA